MKQKHLQNNFCLMFIFGVALLAWGLAPQSAMALSDEDKLILIRNTGVPDYNGSPNWAYSPTTMRKFVDGLPGLCGSPAGTDADGINNLGQCMPVAVPDTDTYPGSDYYEFEIVQFREQMHSDLPPLLDGDATTASSGGTLLRGYRQANAPGSYAATPHNLGPIIVAEKDRPVRIKFTNKLPINGDGDLFIPTDTTVMGSGPGPTYTRDNLIAEGSMTDAEVCNDTNPATNYSQDCYSQNRATLHLHGGRTPWISDGTAHQWITPAGEFTGDQGPSDKEPMYSKGVSVAYVPDMWFADNGTTITECAGQNFCSVEGATNNPGDGSQTYYWTNAQSARLMFYHEHSWGITRLGVYAGAVAGYVVTDDTEQELITANIIPDSDHTIPLIIQDKTFVDADTIVDVVTRDSEGIEVSRVLNAGTDPTWIWGSQSGTLRGGWDATNASPVTGDLWWPHVYVPAQNPYHPDLSGTDPYGRWHYGPWFWPPTDVPWGPIVNPYYDGEDGFQATKEIDPQPPEIPSTPNPSWGAEAFMDTPVVNGTAYPTLNVDPTTYRFKILNGAHDRFWNLQLYTADLTQGGYPIPAHGLTEVKMVPAVATPGFPGQPGSAEASDFLWPTDGRDGGVPDPATRGPAMVQIGTEGGFLPAPVVLKNRPVNWNVDPTTFTAGLVLQQNQGGGTLMLGPAERADVVVDFSQFAGKTLILYNDAPAPWPALDPHYDYYTDNPDYTEIGGTISTQAGFGPNTRTIMRIVVSGFSGPAPVNAVPANLGAIQTAFLPRAAGGLGVFDEGQEPIIVGQTAYNNNYPVTFPATWPNWGISRITDTSISFMTPDGSIVKAYPMEPKAIQDEMGEVFDEFGRMSAKLGLELAKTTAGIQTFILQNFVDPPTEFVAKDQIQIWKITHNGVDTHPVHFHLFEVQLLNRVGWDGFIYLPDPNELGWKDTVRISPLEDTIVALRPAKVPVPFTVPNSMRPLNPAYPLGGPAGFTNIDPTTGQPLPSPVINEIYNFGQEYLWHCHILSHEEQDMMRPIVLNDNSILYTLNDSDVIWQWNRGEWTNLTSLLPDSMAGAMLDTMVVSGTYAFADYGDNGIWQWNGYDWRKIDPRNPLDMVASEMGLYVSFEGSGLYQYNYNTWTRLNGLVPEKMLASESGIYAAFTGYGLYHWTGSAWSKMNGLIPVSMTGSGKDFYAAFDGYGLYHWTGGSTWTKMNGLVPAKMAASGANFFAAFTGYGLYQWTGGSTWNKINGAIPASMTASGSDFYAAFTGYGLYQLTGGSTWNRIDNGVPSSIDSSGSVLYANFGGVGDNGVKKWEYFSQASASWSLLQNTTAVTTMEAGF